MSKLNQLKTRDTDKSKINAWLDKIGETDQACRDEVIELCKNNTEARAYYVSRYERGAA